MELFNGQTQTLLPGQRLIRVKGYSGAEKYSNSMPRDCEASMFDDDDDYCYVAKTDTNGGVQLLMFKLIEEEAPVFKPDRYVTKEDFNAFKEDILNGFNTLQQAITSGNSAPNKRYNGNKQSNQPNTELSQPAGTV